VALPWPGVHHERAHRIASSESTTILPSAPLGFELHSRDTLPSWFARYVAAQNHHGPLTADLMIEWAHHDKWHHETPATWAVRLAEFRHFARYLKQFEPDTEVPDESVFGPEAGRVAPHIFHDEKSSNCSQLPARLGLLAAFDLQPMKPCLA